MGDGVILVLGAGGMLGKALVEAVRSRGGRVVGATRRDIDIADLASVTEGIRSIQPDLVVNAAAWTDVDSAESNEPMAAALNAVAPEFIARACHGIGAGLVHVSTDYVFPGTPGPAWRPTDTVAPVNAYGRTKATGEQAVANAGLDYWWIARTAWLYDARGTNFLTTIARLASENDEIHVVNDQFGRPTSVRSLAPRLLDLAASGRPGIHHVCDQGAASWFDFATAIVDGLELDCRVAPCSSEAFPRPARRPRNGILDTTETDTEIGAGPHWRSSLESELKRFRSGPLEA